MSSGEAGGVFVNIGADVSELEAGLSNALSMVADAGGKMGQALAGAAAIAGGAALGAVTALGAAGVAAWSDMDAAADTLMQRTGAVGEALDTMTASVANLKGSTAGVGASMADIGNVMADVASRTGATGPALEQLTGTLLQLQNIQGQGAVSASAFGQAMNSWGVAAENGSALLDQLFAASQQTGTSTAQLAGNLTQFGGALREMGIGLDQSIAMFSQLDAAGLNATTVMTGLRTATAQIAESGGNIQAGLSGAISAIQNADNATTGLQIAIDAFGARAGPALADAIRQGTLTLDGAVASMGQFEGAIASAAEGALDFPDRFAMGMAGVQNALVPVGQAIMDLADTAMPILQIGFDLASSAAGSLATALQGLQGPAEQAVSAIVGAIQSIQAGFTSGGVAGGAQRLLDAIGLSPEVSNTIAGVIDQIAGAVQSGLATVRAAIAGFQSGGTGGLLAALGIDPAVASQVASVLGQVVSAVQTGALLIVAAAGMIGPIWDIAFSGISSAIATALPYLQQFASIASGFLIGALNALGVAIGFVIQNFAAIASVVATVVAGFGAFAIITTVVGWVSSLIAVVQGVGIVIASAGGIIGTFTTILGGIAAVILSPIGAIALLVAAVVGLAVAWATNMGGIQEKTALGIDSVRAHFDQLAGYLGAFAGLLNTPLDQMGSAWGTFTERVGAVTDTFNTRMSQIAGSAAAVSASVVDSAGVAGAGIADGFTQAAQTVDIKTELMRAVTEGNIGAIPGLIGQYLAQAKGSADSWLSQLVSLFQVRGEQMRQAIPNVSQMGQADREDRRVTSGQLSTISSQAIQASAQSAQRATSAFSGLGSSFSGLGGAASGAGTAAKTAEEKIQQAAAAINAVTETVKKVSEFIKDGLANAIVGDPADQLLGVISNIANFGRSMATTFAAAATGLKDDAFKAAQTLSQGISAAASGLSAVVGLLPKLWEFVNSPEWGEMQGSLGTMLGVASQLIAWGRGLFDVMAAASAGVTEESAKAAQALAQGISASAQAVSAVIGLLPKLWEFVNSPEFDDIMSSLPMLAEVAGKLIQWGKILFDLFSAAAEGVSAESAAAAQALAQGIGAAAQAITAVINLIPLLLDFSKWADGMAVLEGPGRDAIMQIVTKLSELGRLIFEAFAAAAAGISAKSVAAAQKLADGVKSAGDGLLAVINLVPALLNFAAWESGFQVITSGQVQASIVFIATRLAELGRLILTAWGKAAGDLSGFTLQGVNALRDGVKAAGEGLTTLIALIPALLNYASWESGFQVITSGRVQQTIVFIATRLANLGAAILAAFSQAGGQFSTFTVVGARVLADGIKAASDALVGVMTLAPQLLTFASQHSTWLLIASDQTRATAVHVAIQLAKLGHDILLHFSAASGSFNLDVVGASKLMAEGVTQASTALVGLMTLVPQLLAFVSNHAGWLITTSDALQATIVYVAIRLVELGRAILHHFSASVGTFNTDVVSSTKLMADGVTSAATALTGLMELIPQLLSFVSNYTGWAAIAAEAVRADLVYIASRLASLGRDILQVFGAAAGGLQAEATAGAKAMSEALTAVSGGLIAVMELVPKLATFVTNYTGWAAVASDAIRADIVYIAGRLSDLGRLIYDAFARAAGELTSEAVSGSRALSDGISASATALGALVEVVPQLLTFVATAKGWLAVASDQTQADIEFIAQRLSALGRRIYDAFSAAAGSLTQEAVAGSRALADGIGAAASALQSVLDIIKLLTDPVSIPNADQGSPLALYITGLVSFARRVTDLAEAAADGFKLLATSGLQPLAQASGDALTILQNALDAIKMLAERASIPTLDEGLKTYLSRLVNFIEGVTVEARNAADSFAASKESGLSALATEANDATGVLGTALDTVKSLTERVSLPALDKGLKGYIQDLVGFIEDVTTWARAAADSFRASKDSGLSALATEAGDATSVLGSALDAVKAFSERPVIPTDKGLKGYIQNLVDFIEDVTEWAREAAESFRAVKESALSALAAEAGDATSVFGSALDAVKLFAERPALPQDKGLRAYLTNLVGFIEDVTTWAREAAEGFQAVKESALSALAAEASDATGVLGSALDAVKLFTERPPLPDDKGLKTYLTNLVNFVQRVTEDARAAAADFRAVKDSGLSALASEAGDATGVLGAALDAVKLFTERVTIPALDSGLVAYLAGLVGFIQRVTEEARTAAADFAAVKESGLSALAAEAGDATSVLQSALDAIKLFVERAQIPPLDTGLIAYIQRLTDFIQGVTEAARDAAADFSIAEDSGLSQLASAVGDALTVLTDGLDITKTLAGLTNFKGVNWSQIEPKFKLLLSDVKSIAQRFAEMAAQSGISDAFAEAGAKVASLFGDAVGALNDAIDLGARLLDPETQIPSIGQIQAKLSAVLALLRAVVTQFAQEAASLAASGFNFEQVNALAESMSGVFDAISSAIEAVQAATGIAISGSGFNNIRALLHNLFDMFEDFSGSADAVNQVTAAISSMLGGIENLVAGAGTAAGAGFVDNLVAALVAGTSRVVDAAAGLGSQMAGAVAGAGGGGAGGAGAGMGGGTVINNYTTITHKNINLTQITTPDVASNAGQSVYSLQATY